MPSVFLTLNLVYILALVAVASFALCLATVLTTPWHGKFTIKHKRHVQDVHLFNAPRVGGLPIVLAIALLVWATPLTASLEAQNKLLFESMFLCALPAFAAGFAEDVSKKIAILPRLIATLISGVLAWYITGYSLTHLGIPVVDSLLQQPFISVALTAFAVAGVANAVNIIDGQNGLASSMAFWGFLGLAALADRAGDTPLAIICLIFAAAIFGFLCVNWPFGKLFLGDGGCYFFGFSLAWACVLLVERSPTVSAFAALLLCFHPVVEVIFTIYRRLLKNKHLCHPDHLHLHSLFKRRLIRRIMPNSTKTSRNSVSGILLGGFTLLAAIVVQFTYTSTTTSIAGFMMLAVGYVWIYHRLLIRFRAKS